MNKMIDWVAALIGLAIFLILRVRKEQEEPLGEGYAYEAEPVSDSCKSGPKATMRGRYPEDLA